MLQHVRGWMKDLVVYVDPDATVADALSIMRHRYINSVIVQKTETNPEYGIVTSIDICDKIVAQQRNPTKVKIREIMSSPLITVHQDSSVQECAALMKSKQIHHLPVVNDEGNLVEVISATDFLIVAEAMGNNFSDRTLS